MDVVLYRCLGCDRDLTGDDVKRLRAGGGEMLACGHCGMHVREERSRVVRPIAQVLATAFTYPLRPLPLVFSLGVTAFAGAASFLPFGAFVAAGIRAGWLLAVLRAASNGQDDVEIDPSNISPSIASWVVPALRVGLAAAVAFLPAALALVGLGEAGVLPAALLGLLGAVYLPAALIIVAASDGFFAPLNAAAAIGLMRRIPRSYFTACAMLLGLFALTAGALAAGRALEIPLLGFVIDALFGFLPLVAAARLLGLLVHEEREEL